MRPNHSKRLTRRGRRVAAAAAAVLVSLATSLGCNRDDTISGPPIGSPALGRVILGGHYITLAPGQSASVPISIERDTYDGNVALVVKQSSGPPSGVTATIDRASLVPGATSATLRLSVASSAAAGEFVFRVDAAFGSAGSESAYLGLVIDKRPPTLAIDCVYGDCEPWVVQGDTWGFQLLITRTGGFHGEVQLTIEGLPSDVTAAFDAATLVPTNEMFATTAVKFTAAADARVRDSYVIVHARGEGVPDATVTLQLWVMPRWP